MNKAVTKKNSNNFRKYAITVALVAVVAMLILCVVLTNSSNAYADTSNQTSTYKQIYFDDNLDLKNNVVTLGGLCYIAETKKHPVESFEYVITLNSSEDTELDSNGLWFFPLETEYDYDYNVMFGIKNNEFTDNQYVTYLAFGPYSVTGIYDNEYNFDLGNYGDKFYLTLTESKFEFSYFPWYKDTFPATSEYEAREVLVSFNSDSEEYKSLFKVFLTMALSVRTTNDSMVCNESVRFYKYVEAPYKEGYIFTGWYYDEACTELYKGEAISEDTKLYAGFEKKKYRVTFDASGIVDPEDPNTQGLYDWSNFVEYGGVAVYDKDNHDMGLPNIDELPNIKFAGWFFENGTKYENTPIYEDTTLYANFYCTVSFDLNGGYIDGGLEPIEVVYGSKLDLPTPIRDKYGFDYWSIEGTLRFTKDDFVKEDMTLVAEWYRNVFNVTFYVDNEVWKEVEVELGKSLYELSEELEVDSRAVIGFENLNYVTNAIPFSEYNVEDDMAVYLTENFDIPAEPSNSDDSTSNVFVTFWDNVKAFFNKIGKWFEDLFRKMAFWKK